MGETLANVIAATTPAEAWDGWVGNQTTDEFMAISRDQGHTSPLEAARAYANDLPNIWPDELGDATPEQLEQIAQLLADYIGQQTYRDKVSRYEAAMQAGNYINIPRWALGDTSTGGNITIWRNSDGIWEILDDRYAQRIIDLAETLTYHLRID